MYAHPRSVSATSSTAGLVGTDLFEQSTFFTHDAEQGEGTPIFSMRALAGLASVGLTFGIQASAQEDEAEHLAPRCGNTDPSDPDLDGTLESSCIGECSSDNERTQYRYDGEGNLIRELPPGSEEDPVEQGPTVYEYDELSRITAITDGSGNRRTLSYDHYDRVIEVRYESGRYVRYSYDGAGNRVVRSEGERNVAGADQETARDEYDYDERNLLVEERLREGRTNSYAYDAAGNLASLEDPSGETRYTYNAVNLVQTITEPPEGLTGDERAPFAFNYDDDNRRTEVVLPNGVEQDFEYEDDRLERIRATSAGGTVGDLVDLSYSYDAADSARPEGSSTTSLRQQVTDHARNITTRYDYDHLNRISLAELSGSVSERYGYAYSGATNLIRTEREDGQATRYAYNEPYELRCSYEGEARDQDECRDPATTYDYDQNGNLLSAEGGNSYDYNERNQTQSITPSGTLAEPIEMGYADADQNERLRRGQVEFTDNALGLGYQADGGLVGTDLFEQATFFTHDAEQGEGERTPILGMRAPQGDFYYLTDSLGSVVALTDEQGSLAGRYRYDPYGQLVENSEAVPNPIRFAGQYHDAQTGLYKMGVRYYDPTLGRWTQKDPLNLFQDPTQGNRYVYAGADPVNQIDPSGRSTVEDVAAIIAGGGAVAAGVTIQAVCAISLGDTPEALHCLSVGASLTVGGGVLISIGVKGEA